MNLPVNKEQQNQAVNLVYKSILGFVPGGHIIEELTGFRGAVQQERLSKFSEFLKEGFEAVTGKSFDPENLKTEEFIDAFEVIIRKVATTSSEEKLKRYRNVLLRTMYEWTESEMFFKFVGLIDEVTETQMLILGVLTRNDKLTEIDIIRCMSDPEKYLDSLLNMLKKDEIILFNGQTVSMSEITFYIHELKSMGLISVVPEVPIITREGEKEYSRQRDEYGLSPTGRAFLKFIHQYGK